jgi:hypothetical protein
MGPAAVATGLPTATSWYMNPYFMASFGAVVALGFVLFALAYFVFVKLKVGQAPVVVSPEDRCGTCGLTQEMISRMIPCRDHGTMAVRIETVEKWQGRHDEDYRELMRRVNALEKGKP